MAYWVHVQDPNHPERYTPPAPDRIPRRGYVVLRVTYGPHELVFSSPEQLAHFIAVLASKPMPTTRALSARRGSRVGPNGHWLSRLPSVLKAPAARGVLVRYLREVQERAVESTEEGRLQFRLPPSGIGLRSESAA